MSGAYCGSVEPDHTGSGVHIGAKRVRPTVLAPDGSALLATEAPHRYRRSATNIQWGPDAGTGGLLLGAIILSDAGITPSGQVVSEKVFDYLVTVFLEDHVWWWPWELGGQWQLPVSMVRTWIVNTPRPCACHKSLIVPGNEWRQTCALAECVVPQRERSRRVEDLRGSKTSSSSDMTKEFMGEGAGVVVVETVHLRLGASKASRWLNCPGSLQEDTGTHPSGAAAWFGTVTHALAERCLTLGGEPENHIGDPVLRITTDGETEVTDTKVTPVMARMAAEYVQFCRGLEPSGFAEITVTLGHLDIALADVGGTADYVAHGPDGVLHVVDLKTGKIRVPASSKQMLIYALGVMGMTARPITSVKTHVVQPRLDRIDHATVSWASLRDLHEELLSFVAAERIRAKTRRKAPLYPGRWCRHCPVYSCPSRPSWAR